ncbi:MAG TPA: hypothetical protein DC058_08275 [Planctomycetaceae bacterium]|nr:hypothetical protein [Planctomycetaceae bacterium]HBC61202.1 hypothetical protein [Planctomycetaceae bacterium]
MRNLSILPTSSAYSTRRLPKIPSEGRFAQQHAAEFKSPVPALRIADRPDRSTELRLSCRKGTCREGTQQESWNEPVRAI